MIHLKGKQNFSDRISAIFPEIRLNELEPDNLSSSAEAVCLAGKKRSKV